MKKIITKITMGLLLALAAIQFTSCGYEPVFYGIMHDVLPEEATVTGNINSIARCSVSSTEYLFLSNGGSLVYKPLNSNKHGEWTNKNIKLPFKPHHYNYFATSSEGEGHKGQQILQVLSDSTNIYLLTANYKQDDQYGTVNPDTIYLWTCSLSDIFSGKSSDWKNIAENNKDKFPTKQNSSISQFVMNFYLFSTNTPQTDHRKAYLAVKKSDGADYYELNGASTNLDSPMEINVSQIRKVNSSSKRIHSSFFLGITQYFSDSLVVATNETTKNSSVVCLAGVTNEELSTKNLYTLTTADSDEPEGLTDVGSPVASLAFTADSLLIGKGSYASISTGEGGISRILLKDDGNGVMLPEKKTAGFETNAKYQFTSSYILMTLLCADPSKPEKDASLYTTTTYRGTGGTASFKDIGLWSYYPSRGNWNRE